VNTRAMGSRKDITSDKPVEMKIAIQYWTQAVRQKLSSDTACKFEQVLTVLLYEEKIKDHWHPENPLKGQAHRSLSLDRIGRPEPVLLKAGIAVGLNNIFDVFPSSMESVWMWINPGEVVVRTYYAFAREPTEEVLFKHALPADKVDFVHLSKLKAPHHSEEFWQDYTRQKRAPSPTNEFFSNKGTVEWKRDAQPTNLLIRDPNGLSIQA